MPPHAPDIIAHLKASTIQRLLSVSKMGSLSEGETSNQQSERCRSYTPSAEVNESESSSEFSCCRCGGGSGGGVASGSMSSSSFSSVVGMSRFPLVVELLPEIMWVWRRRGQEEEEEKKKRKKGKLGFNRDFAEKF